MAFAIVTSNKINLVANQKKKNFLTRKMYLLKEKKA